MSENSLIEWTDHTFNPWIGCTKVSPGCANCYAESEDKRRGWTPDGWGKGKPRKRTTTLYWKQAIKWNRDVLDIWTLKGCSKPGCGYPDGRPCIGCGLVVTRPRVFPSLCDWLDDEVHIEWLADFLNLIRVTPYLNWLLLTKRPELFIRRINDVITFVGDSPCAHDSELTVFCHDWLSGKPPANVWLGVSVENQDRAEQRIPKLLETPAAVRFLSCEPLLGPLDLRAVNVTPFLAINSLSPGAIGPRTKIDWVIVGGESGPKARLCDIAWIRSLVAQCRTSLTPVFVKQLGFVPIERVGQSVNPERPLILKDRKGGDPAEWPADLRVREMPALL